MSRDRCTHRDDGQKVAGVRRPTCLDVSVTLPNCFHLTCTAKAHCSTFPPGLVLLPPPFASRMRQTLYSAPVQRTASEPCRSYTRVHTVFWDATPIYQTIRRHIPQDRTAVRTSDVTHNHRLVPSMFQTSVKRLSESYNSIIRRSGNLSSRRKPAPEPLLSITKYPT
jgi:hypothetical protein